VDPRNLTAPRRTGPGGSGGFVAAGAGYLGRSAGKWLFEVEVLQAQGHARVGIVGADFRLTKIGGDEGSWAIFIAGSTAHRRVPDCRKHRLHAVARRYLASAPRSPSPRLLPFTRPLRLSSRTPDLRRACARRPVLTCPVPPHISCAHGSGSVGEKVVPGWFVAGGVLGVAVDLDAGALRCTTGARRHAAARHWHRI
jgi:hypothetical protein